MALRLSVPGLVGSQSQFLPTKSATGLGCAWRAAAGARSKRWSGPLKAPAAFTSRRAAIVAASASGAIAVDCLPTIDLAAFQGVPLEDIPTFVDRNPQAKECVKNVHAACESVGFFYLVNHGVPVTLVDGVRDVTREFFSRPLEEKALIALEKSPHFRGYQRVGQNITKNSPDWHEALDLYKEYGPDHPNVLAAKPLHGPNQWPESPKDFKPMVNEYVNRLTGTWQSETSSEELGKLVMRLIALALELPADTFEYNRAGDSFWVLRAIGYPPLPGTASSQGSLSCGEHTDYGLLTFVNQDPGITALQVQRRDGVWVDAPPIPGAFVVNIGDMLTVWTNGLYQSTLHRVRNKSDRYRVSVPFFYEPNFDAVVEPLPQCLINSGHTRPIYEPVVYGDHLKRKVTTNFA